jgi:hypothetical protein
MPSKIWVNNYKKLNEFYELHGHCLILKSDTDNKRVRDWLHEDLLLNKLGKLNEEHKSLLNKLHVDWKAYGKQWEKWEDSYRKLIRYADKTGSANISQLIKGLGPWLSAQRVSYRQSNLSESKSILLESIGINWNPSDNNDLKWNEKFQLLIEFKKENGHCNISRRELPDPGIWVSAQRTAYRLGRLPEERINKLENIGFEWSVRS